MSNIPDKCHWCGDTDSGFYHVECALKMSHSNCKMYSEIVANYQEENQRLREELMRTERRLT